MDFLTITDLSKSFNNVKVLKNVTISVPTGELLGILGPSGCGKSTLLRCIAGLEDPENGSIEVGGIVVFSDRLKKEVPPEKRNIGMIFQSYAIWPHMSVFDNVAYGLRLRNVEKENLNERVFQVLKMVRLDDMAMRPATQLSGGQQQRVAVARALAFQPQLLLFDEPLSNLDAKLRKKMRSELKKLQKETKITTVYVTHDQEEALAISDNIVIMREGETVQYGTPQEIFSKPLDSFVADFMGATNLFEGTLLEKNLEGKYGLIRLTNGVQISASICDNFSVGQNIHLAIRPRNFIIDENKPKENELINSWYGKVQNVNFLGEFWELEIEVESMSIVVQTSIEPLVQPGQNCCLHFGYSKIHCFH